jgi:hypothetical protein
MRLLLLPWLVFFIGSCISPYRSYDFTTPDSIYPALSEYYIRTRIVVEYIASAVTDDEGEEIGTFMIFGEHSDTILKELEFAEKIFAEAHIKFHITKVEFQEYGVSDEELFLDAAKYPNHLTLYFRLPRIGEEFEGLSGGPYEGIASHGILLSFYRMPWTVAHEIGHYFGLLHTFREDYCADTPAEEFEGICSDVDPEDPDSEKNNNEELR